MIRLCTICARGGSKGVPGKNVRDLFGKPLIAWSVEQAKMSNLFNMVAVSSDDKNILDAAKAAGADLMIKRPINLATDTAGKIPAIKHAVEQAEDALGYKANILVDLDATSPLRSINDIKGAIELLEKSNCKNVITGSPARRSPYFNLVEQGPLGNITLSKRLPKTILRRQDSPKCFDMNASIYVWKRMEFMADPRVFYSDTKIFEMPEERSIDVDTEIDFEIVKLFMQRKLRDPEQ